MVVLKGATNYTYILTLLAPGVNVCVVAGAEDRGDFVFLLFVQNDFGAGVDVSTVY